MYDGLTRGVLTSCLFASIGAVLYGVDNSWWGTALGYGLFNETFGEVVTVTDGTTTRTLSASQQSAGSSIGQAGIMVGCALAAPLSRVYGRRAGVVAMSIISIIGIIIQLTSTGIHGNRYWQLVAGKFNELAPAKWRGFCINLYQTVSICGLICGVAAVYSLSERTTVATWQVPIGLQLFAPVALLIGVKWMPESPRWLVWNGRIDEARTVLLSLNATATNGYDPEEELSTLQTAFAEEKAAKPLSVFDLFKGGDLRRTLISTGTMCLQQGQGSSYMNNYIVLFLQALGLTDVFKIVLILDFLYLAAILLSFYLPDKIGRRKMLLLGAVVTCACFMITAGLNTTAPAGGNLSGAPAKAALALMFIWYFFFGLGWSPLVWITCAEVCSARAREPTLSFATFSAFSTSLIITLVSPYIQDAGYGNLGASIGFIWGGFTFVSIFFVWFFIPEMKGLTLEQLDYLFDSRVPTRQFSADLCPAYMREGGDAIGTVGGSTGSEEKIKVEEA
ncbi:hypothetical protein MNV49_005114 [Pseudohyphozyma bogoriensis]|nr:hypothetical protein MNV49_005114 [Pseudohyphozyma bogoriensis]